MSMKFYDSTKLYFTADSHAGHKNIINYCNRPFTSVEEMDKALVNNWNSVVTNNDIVFHLGDFCFGTLEQWINFRKQLNGQIIFIKGNHDKHQNGQLKHLFNSIHDYLEISVEDPTGDQGWQKIVLCHYAFRVWNKSHRSSWSLYGHSHGSLPDDPNSLSFDVGVDCHNYTPTSYKQVKEIMSRKTFTPIDHHR